MVDFDLTLTPSVLICAVAGGVLGLILAMWGTSEIPIIVATVIVFAVLSGIFGLSYLGISLGEDDKQNAPPSHFGVGAFLWPRSAFRRYAGGSPPVLSP